MSIATESELNTSLTANQLAEYEARGFLTLPGLFNADEVAELRAEAERLLARVDLIAQQNLRCRFMKHADTNESLFEVFDPVNDLSAAYERVAHDERILSALRGIYRDEPALFKDKLIFKLPGATGYDLHQDYPPCWPGFPTTFTTVLLAIDAMDEANGCTVVYPGYHKQGLMPVKPGCKFGLAADAVDAARAVPLHLQPGDVAIFGCFVPHASAPNRSTEPRRAFYVSYNAYSDGGNQKAKHYAEFHGFLRKYMQSEGLNTDECYFA